MKPRHRRLVLATAIALLVLPVLAYLLLDAWLESAGGRRAVERALANGIGMPVVLAGEFSVMLWPAIGVSGTQLVVGDSERGAELMRSSDYALALALRPLLDGQLLIESVRFSDGVFYFDRLPGEGDSVAATTEGEQAIPDIRRLEVRDFDLVDGEDEDTSFRLHELLIEDLAEDSEAGFVMDVQEIGRWQGSLRWRSPTFALTVDASGKGPWPGDLTLHADALLAAGTGHADLVWRPAKSVPQVRLQLNYALHSAGVSLDQVSLDAEDLSAEGTGCLLTDDPPLLQLDLAAQQIDLDALPDPGSWGDAGAQGLTGDGQPFGLNLRLAVAELRKGDALAREAMLQIGAEPDCAILAR